MKKNLVKYTLEIEVVFHARFKLTRAPICEWIINRPLTLPWCPSFVRSKILVSSTIAFFFWKEFGRPMADPPFLYVTQLNYQHHLPLLRLVKGLGGGPMWTLFGQVLKAFIVRCGLPSIPLFGCPGWNPLLKQNPSVIHHGLVWQFSP